MTRLFDDPAEFANDMLEGFVAANRKFVRRVPGGVVRAAQSPSEKVAVVVGGGSGHYPAFCGIVGPGFADGAVVGNVFTSPSADLAYSVAKAAQNGGGVFFSYGNYAGDVMNFGIAQDRLNAEGIPTQTVLVTDDIASAPVADLEKRRGIAGDFVVFKAAAAAAEEGLNLDQVVAAAKRANDATRTLGVAFAGCTMPGATEPLFSVPAGMMGLGLGIHGEPGVKDIPMTSAQDLAKLLVEGVLAERPADSGNKVAAIFNGLGQTKYEELFIVWRTIDKLLSEAGLEIIDPEVGELVTSLDMAGCSLTLTWLDADLERWWRAPAASPAYSKGSVELESAASASVVNETEDFTATAKIVPADAEGQQSAAVVVRALEALQTTILDNEAELGRIDAVAGDGDHGRGMAKGIRAAVKAAQKAAAAQAGPTDVLRAAGEDFAGEAGGTSGVLWGAALTAFGTGLSNNGTCSGTMLAQGVGNALDAILTLGKAHEGDKTMIDSLAPFVRTFSQDVGAGMASAEAWEKAAVVAQKAAEDTAQLTPKVGRARPLAERSIGTPDAGAISMALCLHAVGVVLKSSE